MPFKSVDEELDFARQERQRQRQLQSMIQDQRQQMEQVQQFEQDKLEDAQEQARKNKGERFQKIARTGAKIARMAGQRGVGDVLDAAGGKGSQDKRGGVASNAAGKKAGQLAQNKLGASAGAGNALGGAVAGALRGEGVEGIAGGAFSWWAVRIAFGSLFTIVGFIPALLYLNLHFILSKIGIKFFAPMFVWQKAGLAVANLVMLLALMAIPAIIGGAAYAYCQTWTGTAASKVSWVAGTGDFCEVFDGISPSLSGGGITTTGNPEQSPEDDAAAREYLLLTAGVTINQPYPTTSLSGINQAVLNEIVSFARACNEYAQPGAGPAANRCGVVVTGGTEPGHASGPCSHPSGNKFDLRLTSAVDNYIQNSGNFTRAGSRSDGSILYRRTSNGVIYALEGNHWDVGGVGCA